MFLQMSLNVLGNGIEILHIYLSLDTNTRDISLLCSATEIFLLFIPVLKFRLVGIIYGTFYIDNPVLLLQTINIRKFKVKK